MLLHNQRGTAGRIAGHVVHHIKPESIALFKYVLRTLTVALLSVVAQEEVEQEETFTCRGVHTQLRKTAKAKQNKVHQRLRLEHSR